MRTWQPSGRKASCVPASSANRRCSSTATFGLLPQTLAGPAGYAHKAASDSVTVYRQSGSIAACFYVASFCSHKPHPTRTSGAACPGSRCSSGNRDRRRQLCTFPPEMAIKRLKSLLNAPCPGLRHGGWRKHDPMELKMPVGDKNQMVVRVEGGYKQITIENA